MASLIASSSRRLPGVALAASAIAFAALVASPAGAVKAPFVACLVTGTSGTADAAWNRLAAAGLQSVEGRGVVTRVAAASSQNDYLRELDVCARDGAGITIAVGYAMSTAVDRVATAYPRAAFAILDVDVRTLTHRPANVEGLVFRQQEAGYVAGYAAGLWAARRHGAAVAGVGGLQIPPVERALAGFRFGAKRANPGLPVLNAYSGDFTLAAKCRHQALAQIANGAVVEFEVAGACGAGVIAAARAKGMMGIGFGADQSATGAQVLTSVVERADVAIAAAVHAARAGALAGGTNVFFDAHNRGIDIGTWSPRVPLSIRRAVAGQLALLRAGKIAGIPTTLP
jgi:basic membrane protein A